MDKEIYKKLSTPIILIEFYLSFTVLLYAFGPWQWRTNNPILLYLMLIIFQVGLAWGYKRSIRRKLNNAISIEYIEDERKKYYVTIFSIRFLYFLLVVNLIFVSLNVFRTLNLTAFSLNNILNQVILGFLNPSSQYNESKFVVTKFGGSILSYSNVLFAPLLWMSIPLSIYRFKELPIIYKALAMITIILEMARWIGTGTNKGFIDVLIITFAIIFIKSLNPFHITKKGLFKRKENTNKIKVIIVSVLLMAISIYFFSNIIGDRVKLNWGAYEITNGYTTINFDSILMRLCPSFMQETLVYLGSYLTQGYYALSLATSIEWTPMFGVGNSMFLMENLSSILNTDLYQFTYQTKMVHYGWDSLVNWHSFYVWFANDVSLIGVVFVMYILGRFLANIVYDAAILGDNIAIVIFCLLMILFMYIPANNQLFSYPTTFMAFWVLSSIWVFKKKIRLRFRR